MRCIRDSDFRENKIPHRKSDDKKHWILRKISVFG